MVCYHHGSEVLHLLCRGFLPGQTPQHNFLHPAAGSLYRKFCIVFRYGSGHGRRSVLRGAATIHFNRIGILCILRTISLTAVATITKNRQADKGSKTKSFFHILAFFIKKLIVTGGYSKDMPPEICPR